MTSVNMPRRGSWLKDTQRLVALERKPRPKTNPVRLGVHNLLVMEALFQPRGQSLGFRPGASAKHVAAMAAVVKDGRMLDPVVVLAFGPRWVLVDGHHRLAAYQEAGWMGEVPVRVLTCDAVGEKRINWAVMASASLNVKDKLAMSPDDKSDCAWRMVVMAGGTMTKSELVDASTVKDRSIGYMRAVRKALLEAGWTQERLYEAHWRAARWENEKLKGDDSEPDPEIEEKQLRRLMKKLSPVINDRLAAKVLLEALERLRPGLELELETAIYYAKQERKVLEI